MAEAVTCSARMVSLVTSLVTASRARPCSASAAWAANTSPSFSFSCAPRLSSSAVLDPNLAVSYSEEAGAALE